MLGSSLILPSIIFVSFVLQFLSARFHHRLLCDLFHELTLIFHRQYLNLHRHGIHDLYLVVVLVELALPFRHHMNPEFSEIKFSKK